MVEYITKVNWEQNGYEVYIQGLPDAPVNYILIKTRDTVISSEESSDGTRTIFKGCGKAILNENNIDYISEFLKINEDPDMKPAYANMIYFGSFVSKDDTETYYNHIMMQDDLVAIDNMLYSLRIFKNDLIPILNRARIEINKIKLKGRPMTHDDYEMIKQFINTYVIDQMPYLMAYLEHKYQKSRKNNQNKEGKESNKQGDD